jgi:hypothetical protein
MLIVKHLKYHYYMFLDIIDILCMQSEAMIVTDWAVSPPSCRIPTICCLTVYSINPIRFKAYAGICRSSDGTMQMRHGNGIGQLKVVPEEPDELPSTTI